MQTILGIETSCDDTSAAIAQSENIAKECKILALRSFNQDVILRQFGGVVPEIAARNHMEKILPTIKDVFMEAKIDVSSLSALSVTTHPGLLGPLLTGINIVKTLALYFELPINPVNHLFAHLEAIHIDRKVSYPYLGMLVSGGHSLFFLVSSATEFELLSSTVDDASGEAFDKGGKLLNLPYPAGAIIDQLAKGADSSRFLFPIGLHKSGDGNLSFSGVKTSLRVLLEKNPNLNLNQDPAAKDLKDLCASYQHYIVKALVLKCQENMLKIKKQLPIVVGGGVACNSELRQQMLSTFSSDGVFFVTPKYCTDNAAMIANYALRTPENTIAFPECLKIDAHSGHQQNLK